MTFGLKLFDHGGHLLLVEGLSSLDDLDVQTVVDLLEFYERQRQELEGKSLLEYSSNTRGISVLNTLHVFG